MSSRRIGILGGTFDPIHCGHLDVGLAAQASLGLTEMRVMTSNVPPHRPQPSASTFHRFAMVALAVAGRDLWHASDLELRSGATSYTSATLETLHEFGYAPRELFFVLGADAFADISAWKDYPALLGGAHFAVVSRPGFPVDALAHRLPELASRMTRPAPALPSATDPLIFLIDAPTADVSSTAIRRRVAAGQSIAGMVPGTVRQHIEQHGLYRSTKAASLADDRPAPGAAGRLHGQD